jgi:hypothetical protein
LSLVRRTAAAAGTARYIAPELALPLSDATPPPSSGESNRRFVTRGAGVPPWCIPVEPVVEKEEGALMLVAAVEEEDELEEVEPAARVRDEVDVVELADLADAGEEDALETGELRESEPANLRVVRVGAEHVAV